MMDETTNDPNMTPGNDPAGAPAAPADPMPESPAMDPVAPTPAPDPANPAGGDDSAA